MQQDSITQLIQNDPILKKITLQLDQPLIQSTNDVFHDLMSCIIEQQIHYRSTKKIFSKALERAGLHHLTLENFYLLEKEALPFIKLATAKYETMTLFLEYWSQNKLDFNQLSDQEVVDQLSSIKGIGKWTIDMILLYTLKRPDVFPFDDFHLKQVMVSLYGLDPDSKLKNQMLDIAKSWGNQKSLGVLYLLEWKKSSMKTRL
jgi:DNA-3-methyladenine glycosylase II